MANDKETFAGNEYFDRYDPEAAGEGTPDDKRWDKILFRAGTIVQSAELNEIQSMLDDYHRKLGGSIYKDGDVISGLEIFQVKEDGTEFVNILAGRVYMDGRVRHIDQQNKVRIDATGTEYLGLKRDIRFITESEDTSLRDPAENVDNFNQPGAHRRRFDYSWVRWLPGQDSTAVQIYEMLDGATKTVHIGTIYSQLFDAMARRTFDESGNYMLRPFPVTIKTNPDDSTTYIATIGIGKAYVQGYEVELGTSQNVTFERALDVKTVTNEAHTYLEDPDAVVNNWIYLYQLDNPFVKEIHSVQAVVYRNETVSGPPAGGADTLTNTPVEEIYQVADAAGMTYDSTKHSYIGAGTVYTQGVDYQLLNNTVDWSLAGAEPAGDYVVVYGQRTNITQGVRNRTRVTAASVTRGVGRSDVIGATAAEMDGIRAIRITDTAGGTTATWIEDFDYTFVTGRDPDQHRSDFGDQDWEKEITSIIIDWGIGGSAPGAGSTYYVTYDYWSHPTEGDFVGADSYSDYDLIDTIEASDNFTDLPLRDTIDFRGFGQKPVTGKLDPVPGENLLVTYDYYLGRVDLIYMTENGDIFVKRGSAGDEPRYPDAPSGTIGIAYLRLQPYTGAITDVTIQTIPNRRYTMSDVEDLEQRIKRLEYFQSRDLLEESAIGKFTIAEKRGIFTDNFVGSAKSDLNFNDGTLTYTCSVDPTERTLRLGFTLDSNPITVSGTGTQINTDDWENSYTLPFSEIVLFEQPYATGFDSVQPFEVFDAKGELELTPESDFWVDTASTPKIEVDLTGDLQHRTRDLGTEWGGWRTISTGWRRPTSWGFEQNQVRQRTGVRRTLVPETREIDLGDRIIDTSWILKIRTQTLLGQAYAMRPNITGLQVTFAGDRMTVAAAPASAVSGSAHPGDPGFYVDTVNNTVRTDENGFTAFQFTIPSDTFDVGEHEVRIDNPTAGNQDRTFATHAFEARGLKQTKEQTHAKVTNMRVRSNRVTESNVVTQRTWLPPRQQVRPRRNVRRGGNTGDGRDPLAQTFTTPPYDQMILSSIDLYFHSKDDNEPVLIQLRDTLNGYPASGILTWKELNPGSINTSSDGSLATNFSFRDPVVLQPDTEYAIVVYSRSPNYNIFFGELGEVDLSTGVRVTSNPFSGVYFRSANASAWQANGYKDMKFRLYRANFDPQALVNWNNVTGLDAGWIAPHITKVEPIDTRIDWRYSIDAASLFSNLIALDDVNFNTPTTQFQLQAKMVSEDEFLSPIIHKDKIGIIEILSRLEGNYFSNDITLDTTAQFCDLYLDEYIPTTTQIKVYWSTDGGHTWNLFALDPTTPERTLDSEDYTERHYFAELGGIAGTGMKIRIEMKSTNQARTPKAQNLRAIFY